MSDPLTEITRERVAAQGALVEAERRMKADSRDPKAFKAAKAERQAAVEALERLDWAEQAERERQEADAQQARLDKLREVQAAAVTAHARARELGAEVAAIAQHAREAVLALRQAQEVVTVGVGHETYAVRDRVLERPTVESRVAVDKEAALVILRVGRELCRLAGMSAAAVDQQAAQGRL